MIKSLIKSSKMVSCASKIRGVPMRTLFFSKSDVVSSQADFGNTGQAVQGTEAEPLEEVQDVSINGLPLEMVKNAAAAAIKRGVVSSEPVAPLGRWKVDPSKAESAHYE